MKRIKINSKDSDGKVKVVYVTRPTKDESTEAQLAANTVFKEAITNGALVRKVLEGELERQGIWSDDKQKELDELNKQVREKLVTLKKGGIKKSEGRKLAVDVRLDRAKIRRLLAERNEYDEYTAESQAENAKFDTLLSLCIKDEEGKYVFKDIDDYRDNGDQPFAIEAATKLASILYGLDEDWEANLPENRFLKLFEYVDDDLRLVDEEGKYVSVDGKHIDDQYRYVNEEGKFVDEDGNLIDDDGLPVVEFQPFLDDDGNPIVPKSSKKKSNDKSE
jgi:hypothetical protein